MDPIAIIIGLILLGAASAFAFRPFRDKPRGTPKKGTARIQPREARTAALCALRDLDFDFRTGKVSEEDYPVLRAQLVLEAAQYMDAAGAEDDRLEDLIRARKAATEQYPCPKCGKGIAGNPHFCPGCGAELAAACPSCGKPVKPGDLFCSSCGTKIELLAEAAA